MVLLVAGCVLTGISTQQVMQAVPARSGRLYQVGPSQLFQQLTRVFGGRADQRGRGVAVEVGTRMLAQQPECPRDVSIQLPVGPGQHALHGRMLIAACVQQALVCLASAGIIEIIECPGEWTSGSEETQMAIGNLRDVVSRDEWLTARQQPLAQEKELTRTVPR